MNTNKYIDQPYEIEIYDYILNNVVIPYIGHSNVTNNLELEQCCNHFLKDTDFNFLGIFASDNIPKVINKNEICICNLQPEHMPGNHWVAFTYDLFYDSFGRPLSNLMNYKGFQKNTDFDSEQSMFEGNCGQRSIAWILIYYFWGSEIAKKN